MDTDMSTIVLTVVIVFFLCLGISGWCCEKRDWNRGIHRGCGGVWEHVDTNSQGGRSYFCSICDAPIWISYPVDT